MMDVIIKQEPCSLEEDNTHNYAWTAGQVSTLSKQVKQESESTLVTAEPDHADTLTAFSYKAQHKKSVNALNRSQPNILCRKKPIVGKLPIPRLNIQYTVISKRKRKRGKYKIKSRPLIVPSIESDPLHGNFNLLPETKIALSALCQKMGSKDKPIASATIFSNNQQQNTAHTNLIPQIPVGTATIFCANQQQNLLQHNTMLNNTVQDNTNRQQHIGSPIIVPTNQLQNLTQQNSALMRNVNEENTNRQHQRGTPVIVSSDQQQHLSQQKNIIFQNASQQIQTSPFLSSNNIFTAGTGLALQPMVLPTVIQQPISNISGFIIPTGTTYLPTSTLLTASSNSQVVQSLNLMPSMPVVNGLPLFQNIPTGVQNTRNAVLVGNQTKGTDLSSSQQLTFGIPIISGNSVGRVSAGLESSLNKTGASVSGRSENTDGNQAGNEAVDQLTSSRATDANKANASNVQRVVYLRKAEESCADTSTNIDSNVPYIETLPSGQQIIRNLNPIDMKCISGLSFPLLPPDIKSTTATSSVESHVTKTQTATTDGRTMRPGITSEHMLPPRLNGVTRKYSLLYNTQKEALQSICSNSDTKKVLNPNYCFGKTSNSQVFASSFFMSSNNGNVLMPLTSIAPEYNPTKPSTEVNKDTNVELNTSHLQSIKCKVTSLDVTGTNSQERSCPDIMIKQEKIDDTSGSVANMLGVGVRQAKSNADTKQKKYDQAHGTQQMPSQQPADQEQIEGFVKPVPPLTAWYQVSQCHDGQQDTQIQPFHVPVQKDQTQKETFAVKKRIKQANRFINKIKMVKRNHSLYQVGNLFFCRSVDGSRTKQSTIVNTQKKAASSDGSSKPMDWKVKHSILDLESSTAENEYIHHDYDPGDNKTNVQCSILKYALEQNADSAVFQEEMNACDDSIEIKIDTVFSLNEESGACFLASKSPYHYPDSSFSHDQKLDACFVVLEKESHSRFLALQMKVSRLRPKRACSNQCRAHALHMMCRRCSFLPVFVQRLSHHSHHRSGIRDSSDVSLTTHSEINGFPP